MSCNEALGETKAQIRENVGVAVSLSEEASHSPKLILTRANSGKLCTSALKELVHPFIQVRETTE